jgi:hypothetical protein
MVPDHTVTTSGKYEIHRFTRPDHGQGRSLAGACWKPGTFVFGQTPDDVLLSLDVLDGRAPALAKGSLLASAVPPGTIFLTRIIEVGDSLPVESPLLKQTEQIELSCGEHEGDCFVRGKLVAKTPEAAAQVKKVADGFVAMARVQAAADEDAVKLLNRVQVRVEDRTVSLDFRISASELSVQLEAVLDKVAK